MRSIVGIFDQNDGKSTVERDTWGLRTGELGGEYIQNRDRDGKSDGYITRGETDSLGTRTGSLGGKYDQHHNEDGSRVGYSFDDGHGRTTYVDTTVPSASGGRVRENNATRGSLSSSNTYSGSSYGDGYSSSSENSFGFGYLIIIMIAILALSVMDEKTKEDLLRAIKTVAVLTVSGVALVMIYMLRHKIRRFWFSLSLLVFIFVFLVVVVSIMTPKEEVVIKRVSMQEKEQNREVVSFPNGRGREPLFFPDGIIYR